MIEREEAVELHDRAGRAQIDHAAGNLGGNVRRRALELGGLHLACDGAQPDQFVKLGLVGIEHRADLPRPAAGIGRPDRFVRLLRILRLGLIFARRGGQVALAVVGADQLARRRDGFGRDLDAVGPHIGDEADRLAVDVDALIEPLGDAHGVRGGKAELAARFLLQRRGGEGRGRIAPAGFRLDVRDGEGRAFERLLEGLGFGALADVEPLDLLAIGTDETRLEGLVARGRERRNQRPILALATNFSISSSRSLTSRSATDWTRPAERAPGSLRHSTGERLKPTR